MSLVIVKSFSGGPDYQVDTVTKTCTCLAYFLGKTRPCKHAKSLATDGTIILPPAKKSFIVPEGWDYL